MEMNGDEEKLINDYRLEIESIQAEDCMLVCLDPDTRTVEIIDKFLDSDKKYMEIDSQFGGFYHVDLYVMKGGDQYYSICTPFYSPTMTELKKEGVSGEMAQELLKAVQSEEKVRHRIYAFERPYTLTAQASKDRKGFGGYYGRQYGDSSMFLIGGYKL